MIERMALLPAPLTYLAQRLRVCVIVLDAMMIPANRYASDEMTILLLVYAWKTFKLVLVGITGVVRVLSLQRRDVLPLQVCSRRIHRLQRRNFLGAQQ